MQVQGLIDCSAELKELVAPGGEEDLFHASSSANFDMIAEEDLLRDPQMASELNISSSAASPTAYVPPSLIFVLLSGADRRPR